VNIWTFDKTGTVLSAPSPGGGGGGVDMSQTLTSTTAPGTPSFVSTQGFKSVISLGYCPVQSMGTTPGTLFFVPAAPVPYAGRVYYTTHPGSVVGVSVKLYTVLNNNASQSTYSIVVNVGATAITCVTASVAASATVHQIYYGLAYPKGMYPFAALANLNVICVGVTGGITLTADVEATIEMGA